MYSVLNENFSFESRNTVSRVSEAVQACDIGGTLSTQTPCKHKVKTYEVKDPERSFGRESRSLKAAYELAEVCNLAS